MGIHEEPAIGKGRNITPNPLQFSRVAFSFDDAGLVFAPCQDLAPGVDDHGMAITGSISRVGTALGRGDYETLVLDRPST